MAGPGATRIFACLSFNFLQHIFCLRVVLDACVPVSVRPQSCTSLRGATNHKTVIPMLTSASARHPVISKRSTILGAEGRLICAS